MGMLLHRHLADKMPEQAEKPVQEKNEAATAKRPGRQKKQ